MLLIWQCKLKNILLVEMPNHILPLFHRALFACCFIFIGHISPKEFGVSLNCGLTFHSYLPQKAQLYPP